MQSWQMQTAKARFSEVVKHAADEGPQEITVHGRPVAVIISPELFDRLSGNQNSLVDFMRQSPLYGREDIKRPYLQLEWCVRALSHPVRTEVQPEDGRVRHWIHVAELGRWLRVVTLPDGVTLHNAFPDRRFKP